MIHLEEKIYFYLLLLLPLFTLLYVGVQLWRARAVKRFAEKSTFSRLASETSHFKPWVKFVFFILVFTFIVIGLVNPKVGTKLETVKREGVDIVFAIDVSKSMLAEDVKPNRIEKAKHIISQVIEQLHGDRVAFVPYAAQAYPQLPLTSDYSAAKIFLQGINTDMLSSQGTAIREAIQTAVDYFKDSGQASKILVILSDGEDHEQGVGDLLQEINDKGIRIFTIGLGTAQGATIPITENGQTFPKRDKDGQVVITKLNQPLLEEIAQGASGKYFDGTNTREVLDNIKKALDNIEKNEYESQVFSDYKDQFQWFLAIAFVLLVIDIFISYKKTSWVRALNLFGEKEKSEK
mgnify:FL=1